jgi:hypothetical protein
MSANNIEENDQDQQPKLANAFRIIWTHEGLLFFAWEL